MVNSPYAVPHGVPRSPPPQSSTPSSHNTKGAVETAGFATAAISAAAGVGALIKGVERLEAGKKHPHGAGSSGNLTHPGAHSLQGNYVIGGEQTTLLPSNGDTVIVADSNSMVDLSAFGEAPFDPRNATTSPDQFYVPQETFAEQTTAMPSAGYTGESSTTDVFQDTSTTNFVDSQDSVSAPFNSTSATDTTTFTDTTYTDADGVTSTVETYSDDQTYSIDETGDDNGYGSD